MPRVQTESQQRCLLLKFIIFSSIDSIKLTRVMAKHKSLATGPNKDGGGELKLTKEPAERDAKLTWIGPKCESAPQRVPPFTCGYWLAGLRRGPDCPAKSDQSE
jgi:hypothetical protein